VSGYTEAGYAIVLCTLVSYAVSLVTRERATRRRLPPPGSTGIDLQPPRGHSNLERP
jgi:hypothetical protein